MANARSLKSSLSFLVSLSLRIPYRLFTTSPGLGSRAGARMPTESQLRDPALRASIARKIDRGELPLIVTKTIGVGFGAGAECVACGQKVTAGQIEYTAFGPKYGAALRLHWGCH